MTLCKRATELAALPRGRGVRIDSQINWAALVRFVRRAYGFPPCIQCPCDLIRSAELDLLAWQDQDRHKYNLDMVNTYVRTGSGLWGIKSEHHYMTVMT
jgi:hypothetical protein